MNRQELEKRLSQLTKAQLYYLQSDLSRDELIQDILESASEDMDEKKLLVDELEALEQRSKDEIPLCGFSGQELERRLGEFNQMVRDSYTNGMAAEVGPRDVIQFIEACAMVWAEEETGNE